MRMALIFLVSLVMVTPWLSETESQQSTALTAIGENIVTSIQSKKPDWKYESVTPIPDSGEVIVQQWRLENQSVRIAVLSHQSNDDARIALQNLGRQERVVSQDHGDEDVTWGRGTVSFRKQHLTVNVSAVITTPALDIAEANHFRIIKDYAFPLRRTRSFLTRYNHANQQSEGDERGSHKHCSIQMQTKPQKVYGVPNRFRYSYELIKPPTRLLYSPGLESM